MGVAVENVSDIAARIPGRKRRNKRLTNYWDILYKPGSKPLTEVYGWNVEHNNGPRSSICPSASRLRLEGASFSTCDFDGVFAKIVFSKCNFIDCDFASVWKYVKFNECTFTRCSFTMATFRYCKFSDCEWQEISVSGSETKFEDTVINNPRTFIAATYTNLNSDVLKNNNKVSSYQKYRHEHTKAKLSKRLYDNSQKSSDESIYYDCVRLYLTQCLDSKIYEVKHHIENGGGGFLKTLYLRGKQLVFTAEKKIISLSGWVNGWGGSLMRPAMLGVFLILVFSIIYSAELNPGKIIDASSFFGVYLSSLLMAIDVTLLFGYTKHLRDDSAVTIQWLGILNAVLGLWWYAIFVPTVINRICRVKA